MCVYMSSLCLACMAKVCVCLECVWNMSCMSHIYLVCVMYVWYVSRSCLESVYICLVYVWRVWLR